MSDQCRQAVAALRAKYPDLIFVVPTFCDELDDLLRTPEPSAVHAGSPQQEETNEDARVDRVPKSEHGDLPRHTATGDAPMPERTTHELKIWPEYFQAVFKGVKTFEVRLNDRAFQVGDLLKLREWTGTSTAPDDGGYTGRYIYRVVTYVMEGGKFGLDESAVILALGRWHSASRDTVECLRHDQPLADCPDCCAEQEDPAGRETAPSPSAVHAGSPLKELRETIDAFKRGTIAHRGSQVYEVETIHKTLNVVLAEIDKLAGRETAPPTPTETK